HRVCDLLRALVGRAVRDAAVRRPQPERGRRGRTWYRSRRAGHGADGLQAVLDHADLGRGFRHRHVGVLSGLSEHRAAVEADGAAVLGLGPGTMWRCVALLFLLLASIGGPAAAMDPSAMEETNCLMACDANQEHCGAGQAPLNRNRSIAAHLSQPEMKASPIPGWRRTTGPSTTLEGKVSR